jgi:hypothetical protein
LLATIVGAWQARWSFGALCQALGPQAFGIALLMLALPNSLPIPLPGVSAVTSVLIAFLAVQLMLGREIVWVPRWLWARPMGSDAAAAFGRRLQPWAARLQNWVRPRLAAATSPVAMRLSGALVLLMAIVLAFPIPLGNPPLGIALATISTAIAIRDGVLMIVGWMLGTVGIAVNAALLGGYGWLFARLLDMYS